MTTDFVRNEVSAQKDIKGQKKVSIAHMINAHARMCKAIREQRIDLNEIDEFLREVNTDGFLNTLQLPKVA
jgi:predicted anti-sigma-YlaC factor YlaD